MTYFYPSSLETKR